MILYKVITTRKQELQFYLHYNKSQAAYKCKRFIPGAIQTFFHIITLLMQKGLRNLSTMFCIFSVHYQRKKYCTFQLRALCVRARTMHWLEMDLMFCYNEFWIYLHICSLFKRILLYRVNKNMFTAIPIQFIMYLY